jgi:hypothetical protein
VTTHSTKIQRGAALLLVLVGGLFWASCGSAVMQGRAPSYLVIDRLQGASGAKPAEISTIVQSDVLTKGSVYEDPGAVTLHVEMKDATSTGPTNINAITLERFHVDYVRSDGRSTQGVDVPFSFDGAVTTTVTGDSTSVSFTLVRIQAKVEAPLMALRGAGGAIAISTIANVTFYGHDQAGNSVSVTGSISVTFADWADPA